MRKRALQVTLDVREPSVVELTVGERVQLDRLAPSHHGYVARRHGDLLPPGVAQLALERGLYFFRTLSAANLHVVRGGVGATVNADGGKDGPWPDPSSQGNPFPTPGGAGDEPSGETPTFTVE